MDRLTPIIHNIATSETQPILSNWFSSNVKRITADNHVKQAGVYACFLRESVIDWAEYLLRVSKTYDP